MQPYAEMKFADSVWLDEVPAHWTVSRFRYEATINGGQVDPREAPWRSMTLLAPNHIESNTGRVASIETAEDQGADSGKYLVEQGQLVYSKIRPALNKAAIAETKALCSADMYAISFRDQIEPRFALYYVLARPFHTFATVASLRVKMPKVNREELAEVPWLVPPLDEQRAIANYLDRETARIDTLIQEQQRLIEMLRERRRALIELIFLEIDADRAALRHFARLVSGSGFPVDAQGHTGEELPFFKVKDLHSATLSGVLASAADTVSRETAASLRATVVPGGSLVFAKVGAALLLGRVGALPVDGCIDNNMSALIFDSAIDPKFARYLMLTFDFARFVQPGAVPSLNMEGVREFGIPLISRDHQRRIGTYLDEQTAQIDELIAETERFIALSHERRAALITAAVTGQINVREVA